MLKLGVIFVGKGQFLWEKIKTMQCIPLTSKELADASELQTVPSDSLTHHKTNVKFVFQKTNGYVPQRSEQAKTLNLESNALISSYIKHSLVRVISCLAILTDKELPHLKCMFLLIVFIVLGVIPITGGAKNHSNVTLCQAEWVALHQAPELKSFEAKSEAFSQSAIAAGQLSDPTLMLGAMNVPVNTFSLSQEPMTQIQVGLMQIFPKGHSLRYRSLQEKNKGNAEYEKGQTMQVQILHDVRISWLNLYYWLKAKQLVYAQKKVFQHLVTITESMLANNEAQLKDVIRAQLEVTELDNQLIVINQQIDTARADLGRWIGAALANHAYPDQLPQWKNPPSLASLKIIIKCHPKLLTDQAFIAANYAGVNLAKQQYKPGVAVGVAYGFRQGHDIATNSKRSDFLTAQVSIDLPLFPNNRQDRSLKASEENLLASQEDQVSHYRELKQILKTQYATWQQQRKSVRLYQRHLIPEANQYTEATLIAYQNTQTDFPTLARAYVRELNTELLGLKASIDYSTARVSLLYLEGE